jgi:hypothetical protein
MIGFRALLTSCITPAASCPMAASCRSRARDSWSFNSSCVRSATMRSSRSASVETRAYSSAERRTCSASSLAKRVRSVTSRSIVTRAAHDPARVAQRVGIHLDDGLGGVALRGTAHHERLATHALAAEGTRGRMFVDEQAHAVERPRQVAPPQVAQRPGLRGGARRPGRRRAAVALRLRVEPHHRALRVEDAHRLRHHVEDRLELRHVARQVSAQRLELGDVAGDEQHAPGFVLPAERGEGRFDHPRPPLVLEGDAHRAAGLRAAEDRVDLVAEVGERVREGVVDGACRALPVRELRQLAVARVRTDERECVVEDGNGQRNRSKSDSNRASCSARRSTSEDGYWGTSGMDGCAGPSIGRHFSTRRTPPRMTARKHTSNGWGRQRIYCRAPSRIMSFY